ncbi:MAG: DUF2207 family protein [Mycobacteriales bacterium]
MPTQETARDWLGSTDLTWGALLQLGIGSTAAIAGWFVLLGVVAYRSRAGFVTSAAASQELGAETPALAHLVTHRWECGEEAAEATLVDLAARGYLAITRTGPEPEQAVCSVVDPYPPDLTPYEQTVMSRVERVAGSGAAPLAALAHGSPAEAAFWLRSFQAEVIADARAAGLSRSRVSTSLRAALVSVALIPGVEIGVIAAATLRHPVFAVLGLLVYGLLARSVWWVQGERDTEAGREAAARWLGMRDYLELHPSFAELGPTAITLWHRYLAYAAALGVARQVLRVLELGPGDDHKAWSAYGGAWRRIRVRYPRRPSWGWAPSRAVATGIGWLMWAAVMVFLSREALSLAWVTPLAVGVIAVASLLGVAYLVGGIVDLVAPLYLCGLVLRVRERRRFSPFSKRYRPKPTRTYVALDVGEGGTARAWVMAPSLRYSAVEGEVARIKVGRCFGYVARHDTLRHSWERPTGAPAVGLATPDAVGGTPAIPSLPAAAIGLPAVTPIRDTPSAF